MTPEERAIERLALQQYRWHALRKVALVVACRHKNLGRGLPTVGSAGLISQEEEEPQADGDEHDGADRGTPVAPK